MVEFEVTLVGEKRERVEDDGRVDGKTGRYLSVCD